MWSFSVEWGSEFGQRGKNSLGVSLYTKGSRRFGVEEVSGLEQSVGTEAYLADFHSWRFFVGFVGTQSLDQE